MRVSSVRSRRVATRLAAAAALVVGTALAGLAGAPVASAADFSQTGVTCSSASTLTSVTMRIGQTLEVASTGSTCTYLWWGQAVFTNTTSGSPVTAWPQPLSGATTVLLTAVASGSATVRFEGSGAVYVDIPVTVLADPSPDAGAGPAPAVPAALTLDLAGSGAVCKDGSVVTGLVGEWLALPGQADCSLPGHASARLLGWSTSASFPVAIAQRQASNGWGTYELTDAEGIVTAVFVPAGWTTYVSGSNTLFPIWAA